MNHKSHDAPGVHSQNDEELHILAYFDRLDAKHVTYHRRFLEIGAYDPIALSNTRALVERGWGGAYVEPAPDNAARFLKAYKDRRDILLVNAAVAKKSELITFFDSGGDALSTSSHAHLEKWEGQVRFTPYLTKTITVSELLNSVGMKFSFINLDVESANLDIFNELPFGLLIDHGLRLVCVEHDNFAIHMRRMLSAHGFYELAYNGENLIFGL